LLKFFIGCFIIILACLSAGALLSFLEKTKNEGEEDPNKDVENKVFRFPNNEEDKWMFPAFIFGLMGFLGLYSTIALLETTRLSFMGILGFVVAFTLRNNSRTEYVRIEKGKMIIYRNDTLGKKKIDLSSIFRADITNNQLRLFQENVEVGKISLNKLREGDEVRLISEVEEYVKVRTNY